MIKTPPKKLNLLTVHEDLAAAMRLKQSALEVHHFGTFSSASTFRDALARLDAEERCEIVFVSQAFPEEQVRQFIADAKETRQGRKGTYILLAKSSEEESKLASQLLVAGIDGFLFEPYSIDELVEIVVLSEEIRRKQRLARETVAVKFLVKSLARCVDIIAYKRQCAYDTSENEQKLRDMCALLRDLQPESLQTYLDLIVKCLEISPFPRLFQEQQEYTGASKRVKAMLQRKLDEELQHAAEEASGILDE